MFLIWLVLITTFSYQQVESKLLYRTLMAKRWCEDNTFVMEYHTGQRIRTKCPKDKPFCDMRAGKCMAHYSFVCPECNGMFPQITTCTGFYFCQDGVASKLACPQNQIFDAEKKKCVDGTEILDKENCISFDCKNKTGVMVSHPFDKSLFSWCDDQSRPVSMNKCSFGYEYDEDRQECVFVCPGIGNVPGNEDSNRYYVCKDAGPDQALVYEERYCKSVNCVNFNKTIDCACYSAN